ncbi:hypothetical protein E1N52_42980 [Paraburkholderia guartelaensis]|uniref:Uncharacterized protein n=1 Tax=Paraburkholderia guartelaensis TaxID=2546446 RepID=A0A4R5L0M7_9BURK|nr:hypothetical protein [Paraburkholderia guartelaensis]TDG01504.1 hypothetical protein E1N52_42980 [Paraburkholderia guartelaensis]
MDHEAVDARDDDSRYEQAGKIEAMALVEALSMLTFLSDDMYLCSQAYNLSIVDQFLMPLEYRILHELMATDTTPPDTPFLLAQSQMWIFAAYELLRTWRQRASDIIKWHDNGGLEQKLKSLRERDSVGFHFGLKIRIEQIERALADKEIASELGRQLRHTYIPFTEVAAQNRTAG